MATLSTLMLPDTFELQLWTILQDESSIWIGTVRGRRTKLPAAGQSQMQPIIVTTFGRTGSSWLLRVLGSHPSIVAYRPFEYEARVLTYWSTVLTALFEPKSYAQILAADISQPRWWLGDASSEHLKFADRDIAAELGLNASHEFAEFVHRRVELFYRAAAGLESASAPRFFVEKLGLDPFLARLIRELYPAAKEIILVRDFRDMICSILAYNEKRQSLTFGREGVDSDEEFVAWIRDVAVEMLGYYRRRSPGAHLVRYEDLIVQPEATLTEVLDWLGVPSDSVVTSTTLASASRETPNMAGHRTAGDAERSVGRWSRDLPPSLRARSNELLENVLAGFGYTA